MSLSINQNITAMNAYRNLSSTQGAQAKSLEKLSSGFRINRAADDAAGLAISEGLRTQVRGNKVAVRNAQDGISVVQTAEGALQEVHSILQRMRELSVQGANDSNDAKARSNIKTETDQLTDELDRIASSTNFNGAKLLDGSVEKMQFQVGANGDASSRIDVSLVEANVANVASDLKAGTGKTSTIVEDTTSKGQATTIGGTGAATDTLTVSLGGTNITTANGDLTGVSDAAGAASALNKAIAANDTTKGKYTATVDEHGSLVVKATKAGAEGGTIGNITAAGTITAAATAGEGAAAAVVGAKDVAVEMKGIDTSSHARAQASITLLDEKISAISTARSTLGAVQNRFEHTINNLNVAVENLSASESRIRDTDMASEMMQFTRNQILSQAGTSMLAQANQIPQGVLSLLR